MRNKKYIYYPQLVKPQELHHKIRSKPLIKDYSKTSVKRPLSKISKMVFKTDYRLMQVESIAECSKRGAFCNTFDLHYLCFVCFWSGRFTQVCCTLLHAHSSSAIILMGKRELVALLILSSWCLVVVRWLFLAVPWGCLRFVIVVFPDHTHYFTVMA